jgi:hypothetical protein
VLLSKEPKALGGPEKTKSISMGKPKKAKRSIDLSFSPGSGDVATSILNKTPVAIVYSASCQAEPGFVAINKDSHKNKKMKTKLVPL